MSNNHRSLSAFRVVFLGQLSSRSAYFTVQSSSGAVHVKSVICNHCVFCKVTQGNLLSYSFTRSHLCSSGHFCPVRYGLRIPLNVVFTFYVTPWHISEFACSKQEDDSVPTSFWAPCFCFSATPKVPCNYMSRESNLPTDQTVDHVTTCGVK